MTSTTGQAVPRTSGEAADAIASAVHELRAPLTTVQGVLETLVLRGDALPDEVRTHIAAVALRNARVLGERIDVLLRGVGVDHIELDPTPVDLAAAVARAVEDNAGTLGRHRVAAEVPDGTVVLVDGDALTHVLANLFSNAAKHSPAGSTITVRGEAVGDAVAVVVRDEGEGIHPDDLPHVFEPWFRGRSDAPGTGLGLAVAEGQVRRWGGTIEATSEVGVGTTVTFTLPLP